MPKSKSSGKQPITYSSNNLTHAVGKGDLALIKKCLSHGVNVNTRDTSGWLPLHWLRTSTPNQEAILRLLVAQGANLFLGSRKKICPLGHFLQERAYDLLFIILEELYPGLADGSVTSDSLPAAILVEKDNCYPLIFYFILYGNVETLKLLVENLEDTTYLTQEYAGVRPLLFVLKQIQFLESTSNQNLFEMAFYLLNKGADPNDRDENGKTVLHYFIQYGNKATVEIFLTDYENEINFDECDNSKNSYMHLIVRYDRADLVDLFIERVDNVDAQNEAGDTALFCSLRALVEWCQRNPHDQHEGLCKSEERENRESILKKLLSHGASIQSNTPNQTGDTVDSLGKQLEKYGHPEQCVLYPRILEHAKIEHLEKEFAVIRPELELEENVIEGLENVCEVVDNCFRKKYRDNIVRPDNDENYPLESSLDLIEKENYVNYHYIKLYEIVKILTTDDFDYRVAIQDRFRRKISDRREDYYYTFYGQGFVTLVSQNEDKEAIIYYLMTSLVYHAGKNSWENEKPQYYHQLIIKLDSDYASHNLERYQEELEDIEKTSGTYFGENLSSDSDSEEEREYQKLPQRKKSFIHDYTLRFFKKSGGENRLAKGGKRFKKDDTSTRASRQNLPHNLYQLTEQEQRDLERLNYLSMTGELNQETLKTLNTTFYVAQYRGISYRIDEGNRSFRKFHRQLREEEQPQFSRAVIATEGYTSYVQYMQALQQHPEQHDSMTKIMLQQGKNTQAQLQQLAASGPVMIRLIGKAPYFFDNGLHALQDLYTKSYDGFHTYLNQYVEKFIHFPRGSSQKLEIDTLEEAIAHSVSSRYSPFVSTSDTPEHALRYAYGDKYYDSYKSKRLRPRWRKDGQAERPYSGKVYISLHEPLELVTRSHHIPSLNDQGKVRINITTMAERETTFFGFIPPQKVVSQHVAKYPSFKGDYKDIYFEKYGLTREFYEKFQRELLSAKPHSDKRKQITRTLVGYLAGYQEVCLIEEAYIVARQRDGILIYRNEFGGFSLYPCKTQEQGHSSKNKKRKQVAHATTQSRQEKREKRMATPTSRKGFLEDLLSNYVIIPSSSKKNSLYSSLAYLLRRPEKELTELRKKTFEKYRDFLTLVAEHYRTVICIHDPTFEIFKPQQNPIEGEVNLYAVGGNHFSALELRKKDLEPKKVELPQKGQSQKNKKRKSPPENTTGTNSKVQKTKDNSTSQSNSTTRKEPTVSFGLKQFKRGVFPPKPGVKVKKKKPVPSTSPTLSLWEKVEKLPCRHLRDWLYELTFVDTNQAEQITKQLKAIIPDISLNWDVSSSSSSCSIGINIQKIMESSETQRSVDAEKLITLLTSTQPQDKSLNQRGLV